MGFWENFWLFTPPFVLVIAGVIFFIISAKDNMDNTSGSAE